VILVDEMRRFPSSLPCRKLHCHQSYLPQLIPATTLMQHLWANTFLGGKAAKVSWPTLLILLTMHYNFHLAKRQKMGTVAYFLNGEDWVERAMIFQESHSKIR